MSWLVVRPKLSGNLLLPHIFTCQVLVCFGSHAIIFGRGKKASAGSEGCSGKFNKIIWKTVATEYFLKVEYLRPETF